MSIARILYFKSKPHKFVLAWRRFSDSTARWRPNVDIQLRQYQEECIDSVLSHLEQGHKRLGVSLATGSGKTVVFTHLIDRVPPNADTDGDRTLILVHRRELVEQAVRHCGAACPGKTVEIEMGKTHATGNADITVASVRSITSGDRLQKFDFRRYKLILVDEAHHIVANTYMTVLEHMKLVGAEKDLTRSPALVGVSATLSRFDGLKLGSAIDQIVYHKDYVDMIGEKWLSNVIFTTIKSHVDMSQVKATPFGDFALDSLSRAVNTKMTNEVTVRAWMARAKDRKSTLVFCVDTAHVFELTKIFRQRGIDARYVTSADRQDSRSKKLEDFRNGVFPVMLNCGVFTEGTDIPNIDCVLLARPTRSRNLLVQMIGRGMRLHPEKSDCHVLDMVASLKTGIVTVPTLFGLDPEELVQEVSVDDLRAAKLDREKHIQDNAGHAGLDLQSGEPSISKVTFTDYDSVHDLIADISGDRHIRALSRHAWVEIGQDKYVLSKAGGDYVTIEGETARSGALFYRVHLSERRTDTKWKGKWRPYRRKREIAAAESFEGAVRAADTFVRESDFEAYMVSKAADWRKAAPTEGQLKFLNSSRGNDSEPFREESITKGQAADMITKIKFGAKGRFGKMQVKARGSERAHTRAKRLRMRELVSVGPVEV